MTTVTVPRYNYSSILKDAAKVKWRVQDLINPDKTLDFHKPFLPETIAQVQDISCLSPTEQLKLNQIRANSYLHLFGLVEEFILPFVVSHLQAMGLENIEATQAYLGFAEEEGKHIHLFREFAAAFEAEFGTQCEVIGPPKTIADFVLQHSPLAVALMTLHIEWMTQRHFLESVRDNHKELLDPQFCRLLKHHWQEEAQHARLDVLMVQHLADFLDIRVIESAMDEYLAIVQYLNEGLKAQVQLDITSLEKATGRTFSTTERDEIRPIQEQAYQQAFLGAGMTHPNFVQVVEELSPAGYARIATLADTFYKDNALSLCSMA